MVILTVDSVDIQCLCLIGKQILAFEADADYTFFVASGKILFGKYLLNYLGEERECPDSCYLYKFHLIRRHPLNGCF